MATSTVGSPSISGISASRRLGEGTIEVYTGNVVRYLKFCKTDRPTEDNYIKFKESLHSWKLSRSTINQYGYSIAAYHKMIGNEVKTQAPIARQTKSCRSTSRQMKWTRYSFSVIENIKHLAMMETLFYGCLRVSELCNLNDEDLDLNSLTIRINNGKGGKSAIVYISDRLCQMS